jgi:hypothetical protein
VEILGCGVGWLTPFSFDTTNEDDLGTTEAHAAVLPTAPRQSDGYMTCGTLLTEAFEMEATSGISLTHFYRLIFWKDNLQPDSRSEI